jgi:FAD/FMN-containing dehydrogenase
MSTDREELAAHGKETSGYAAPEWPQAVVWPLTTDEVSAIVKVRLPGHGNTS